MIDYVRFVEHQTRTVLFFKKVKYLETAFNPVRNSSSLLRWFCLWCFCML